MVQCSSTMQNKVGDEMYDKSQLKRGSLEGCILKIIKLEETYGYEIMNKLLNYGFEEISEGTIYPLLIRLEKKKLISSIYKASPLGPKRKYFLITELGINMLNSFEEHWDSISTTVNRILALEER